MKRKKSGDGAVECLLPLSIGNGGIVGFAALAQARDVRQREEQAAGEKLIGFFVAESRRVVLDCPFVGCGILLRRRGIVQCE